MPPRFGEKLKSIKTTGEEQQVRDYDFKQSPEKKKFTYFYTKAEIE